MTDLYTPEEMHIFKDRGDGQCGKIVSDYVGECGCREDNEVHYKFNSNNK